MNLTSFCTLRHSYDRRGFTFFILSARLVHGELPGMWKCELHSLSLRKVLNPFFILLVLFFFGVLLFGFVLLPLLMHRPSRMLFKWRNRDVWTSKDKTVVSSSETILHKLLKPERNKFSDISFSSVFSIIWHTYSPCCKSHFWNT